MQHRTRALYLLIAMSAIACSEGDPTGPTSLMRSTGDAALSANGAGRLTFMSRNLYIGADLDPVVKALASPSPTDDVPALISTINTMKATDWPSRAAALADEIAREHPHAVGVQEAWTVRIDLTPLGLAVTMDQDFLESLLAELAARGVTYVVAAAVEGVTAAPFPGISVIDRDVILVDPARVEVEEGSAVSQTYAANVGTVAPGVIVRRGFVSVRATVDGVPMTIASTHLESARSAALSGLRALQARQLITSLGAASPVVLMGDFNDDPGSSMYDVVTGAGLTDVWATMRPGVAGLTCCHSDALANANANETFEQRLDYVFTRGLEHSNGGLLGKITRIGASPSDRLLGPSWMIWPSDHAGLSVGLLMPPRP